MAELINSSKTNMERQRMPFEESSPVLLGLHAVSSQSMP